MTAWPYQTILSSLCNQNNLVATSPTLLPNANVTTSISSLTKHHHHHHQSLNPTKANTRLLIAHTQQSDRLQALPPTDQSTIATALQREHRQGGNKYVLWLRTFWHNTPLLQSLAAAARELAECVKTCAWLFLQYAVLLRDCRYWQCFHLYVFISSRCDGLCAFCLNE